MPKGLAPKNTIDQVINIIINLTNVYSMKILLASVSLFSATALDISFEITPEPNPKKSDDIPAKESRS
jgi:hypothetical protein